MLLFANNFDDIVHHRVLRPIRPERKVDRNAVDPNPTRINSIDTTRGGRRGRRGVDARARMRHMVWCGLRLQSVGCAKLHGPHTMLASSEVNRAALHCGRGYDRRPSGFAKDAFECGG